MKILWLFIPYCLVQCAQAQSNQRHGAATGAARSKTRLIPAAQQVRAAYLVWKKDSTSAVQQQAYIKAFPATAAVFTAVFNPKDFGQLYDGHEYVFALMQIGDTYPGPVLRRCITIGKDVSAGSDAPAYLHETIMELGVAHPRLFAYQVTGCVGIERRRLFRFLANVEGIRHYPDYETLMRLMRKNGFTKYAAELQSAKQWRMRQPDH